MKLKTILLTGASKGIGKAIYNELSDTGDYNILAPTREDMSLDDSLSIDSYMRNNQEVDIVINNAGINIINPIENISEADIQSMIMVNLTAPLKIIQKCVPHMKKNRWGKIINISSIWGLRSKEFRTMYSMTKFGVNGITKALARELGEFNILVNSVCPGYVNTEMTIKNVPEEEAGKIKSTIPLRRFAEPSEIARLVKFLVSVDNTYITGETILIDGGFLS
ncbi:MAG TPA: NAD(P)-dependent oxidoreductase [Lentisphaeria bacterium]|nr:MAG: short-chain dehydrogenase [Lentisphaerae bacterium GWF2_38_69]HBM16425.1 NAD(P)-dependent oxidoreductase [Lentisphaeria bacterium]